MGYRKVMNIKMALSKRANTYLGIVSSLLLLLMWIKADYPGFLHENFNGSLARLDPYDCVQNVNEICGHDFNEKLQNLLVGDSEALSITDLFVEKFPDNSRSLAFSGCSFLPTGIVRPNTTGECREWNKNILRALEGNCKKDVFVFNRFKPESNLESRQYLDFLLELGEKCNSLTVIGTPAEIIGKFSAYSSLFVESPIGTPKFFYKRDFDLTSIAWNNRMNLWSIKHQELLKYIDTNGLVLGEFPTRLRNAKNQLLYGDSTHLSKYGGEIIVKSIIGK